MRDLSSEASEAKRKAIRELLQFVGEFSQLVDSQIAEARTVMEATVEKVMSSVHEINQRSEQNLKKADELLIKSDVSSDFVSKSAKEFVGNGQALNDKTTEVKSILSHMSQLSSLDERVQGVLFSIMGALSVDDVIRQRLEHVNLANRSLGQGISEFLLDFEKGVLSPDRSEQIKMRLKSEMFKSFTMEDEKKVFLSVFGE